MAFIAKPKILLWTSHARAKMNFYKLSEQRVRHVLHSPKRSEEGIAPKTVAVMMPPSIKKVGQKEAWSQEIWVMFQDSPNGRKIISAWRFPGMTKPRSEISISFLQREYQEFISKE